MIIYTSLNVPAGATATEMRAGVRKLKPSAGKIFLFQIFFYVWCPSEQCKVSEKIVGDVLQPPEPTAVPLGSTKLAVRQSANVKVPQAEQKTNTFLKAITGLAALKEKAGRYTVSATRRDRYASPRHGAHPHDPRGRPF
ncbi:hypothetical protein ALQ94_200086 [Pseudomonas amygdali pv. morsprunorum]|uniref:Uncharacterized protein n=1 Tax=Pseudomonas amygdali pv. morsprunorum TaxID=129138 RepID=A0A3M2X536_PSEA0|nr:hypothetical protein ALQ94_200086 [Pseudomonas amygdali pv. morsprunorum]